jgi:rRNA maturation RNase YbeY
LAGRVEEAEDKGQRCRTWLRLLPQHRNLVAELGIAFVAPDEIRGLKAQHLGLDEETDVLSFPIDGRDALPDGVPRALGDVVLCPQVVGDEWRWPLVHGLLHLLGYDHGRSMETRERALLGVDE